MFTRTIACFACLILGDISVQAEGPDTPEIRKFRDALEAVKPAKQLGQTLMLKCRGTHSGADQRKEMTELGMLLNFDTRLAFVGGFAMLEMVQVVDNQIVLRSRDGRMSGGIDRVTGKAFLNGYDKDGDRAPVYSADLECKPATPVF